MPFLPWCPLSIPFFKLKVFFINLALLVIGLIAIEFFLRFFSPQPVGLAGVLDEKTGDRWNRPGKYITADGWGTNVEYSFDPNGI